VSLPRLGSLFRPGFPRGTLPLMTEMSHRVCRDPVFILTASRSGSTLLRFILDTHPDFACPPETMITAACVSLLRSWDILENAGSGQQRVVTGPAQLPGEAMATVRDTVDQLYGRYLARRGKPRWCDKSLDSLYSPDLLATLYPEARFICLYRHCMDVIASGIEVCPWGVSRFGFDPYVAQSPGNNVAAIGSYWVDCARLMLGFEGRQPERCHRVRYEDLVSEPEEVTSRLLSFLGAAPAPGITTACFDAPHEGDGPGDEKIWFTTNVSADAMGRGVKVPAGALPDLVRGQINEALDLLGYRTVTDEWNRAAGPVDPRQATSRQDTPGSSGPGANGHTSSDPASNGMAPSGAGSDGAAASAPFAPIVASLRGRIRSRVEAEPEVPLSRWPTLAGQKISLVVTGEGQPKELSWEFPPWPGAGGPVNGDRTPEPVVTMFAEPRVWQALLDGSANVITEIRNGRLRCLNKRDGHRVRSDEVHAIAWLLGLSQVPLTRQPT
jgi:hypothetical protein